MILPVSIFLFHPARSRQSKMSPAAAWLRRALLKTGLLGAAFSGLFCTTAVYAQTLVPAIMGAETALTAKAAPARPAWAELTPAQQKALAPLASSWDSISEPQKLKWLEISKNYATLPPREQAVMNSRMNEWVVLSPQQRAQARLNFGKTRELSRQLTPAEKDAKWQAYQRLSAEEKQRLAAKASPKPKGAATAVQPVAPQKLATVRPHGPKPAPKIQPPAAPVLPQPAAALPGASLAEDASAPSPH